MEIVFIRHGQTDVNKDNRIQGAQVDADLNEFGREYAKKSAAKFDENKFDVVYSSPLKRAVETAMLLIHGEKLLATMLNMPKMVRATKSLKHVALTF